MSHSSASGGSNYRSGRGEEGLAEKAVSLVLRRAKNDQLDEGRGAVRLCVAAPSVELADPDWPRRATTFREKIWLVVSDTGKINGFSLSVSYRAQQQ